MAIYTNGASMESHPSSAPADELDDLLTAVKSLLHSFIDGADNGSSPQNNSTSKSDISTALVEYHAPDELVKLLNFQLPNVGQGKDGLVQILERILKYSVNPWDQGFLHKLYKSTNPVGVVSELVLAVLNSNLHVYQVSPALTIIEKKTARTFASLFGLTGPQAGGTTQPGGSASNLTALVVARNTLFPEIKINGYAGKRLVLFTSAHGHYSFEKAAQICGLGSSAAWSVPVDEQGRMDVSELVRLIHRARGDGLTPFFVNATAGTTVLGAYDPLADIAAVCKQENLWYHVDASWGGPAIFSSKQKHKLRGSELADSLTVNPHKMIGVPVTCSFLLGADISKFWRANTLPAGYLFHSDADDTSSNGAFDIPIGSSAQSQSQPPPQEEVWDLGDLTLQCGRKGDSLKLALGWIYYGSAGYEEQIDSGFDTAAYLATSIEANPNLTLVSENPPPCLQVCFYFGSEAVMAESKERNSWRTREIARRLVSRGFMIDYAPGDNGFFFRVVVHLGTARTTVERLVEDVVEEGMGMR